jgi:hypothetical protein
MQTDKRPLTGSACPEGMKVDALRAMAVQDLLDSRFSLRAERLIE